MTALRRWRCCLVDRGYRRMMAPVASRSAASPCRHLPSGAAASMGAPCHLPSAGVGSSGGSPPFRHRGAHATASSGAVGHDPVVASVASSGAIGRRYRRRSPAAASAALSAAVMKPASPRSWPPVRQHCAPARRVDRGQGGTRMRRRAPRCDRHCRRSSPAAQAAGRGGVRHGAAETRGRVGAVL